MKTVDDFRSFLKEKLASKELSQNALARASKVQQGSISRFMKGESGLEVSSVFKLLDYFNIEVNEPITMKRMGEHSPIDVVEGDGLTPIPIMECAGAGPEQDDDDYNLEPINTISVLQEYLHPGIFACKIVGDSMEPNILDGAFVGVIPLAGNLIEGEVYLVWLPPFGIVAKRVYFGKDKTLILRSDNSKVDDIQVDTSGYQNLIKGKIEWVWQKCK